MLVALGKIHHLSDLGFRNLVTEDAHYGEALLVHRQHQVKGLLVVDPNEGGFRSEFALGYGFALACAPMWSSYSVLNRRFSAVPTVAVVVYCAIAAVGGLVLSLLFERWVTPTEP